MNTLLDVLDNRELSLLIWSFLFLSFFIFNKQIRKSIFNVGNILFKSQISSILLLLIIYTLAFTIILQKAGFWEMFLIKETVLWFIGVGFIMIINLNKTIEKENFLKKIFTDNFKALIVVEFLLNFYVLDFWYELFLIPTIVFLALLSAFSKTDAQYKSVEKASNFVLYSINLSVLGFVIYQLITNYENLINFLNLKEFLLPIILTIALIPFLYILALYMTYENFWVRLNVIFRNNKKLRRYIKWKVLTKCRGNLQVLKKVSKQLKVAMIEDKATLDLAMEKI